MPESFLRSRAPLAAVLLSLPALPLTAREADAQRPLNLGFEQPAIYESRIPAGWWLDGGRAISSSGLTLDTAVRRTGRRSLRVALEGSEPARELFVLTGFPGAPVAGRSLRLAAWVRTADWQDGSVGLRVGYYPDYGPAFRVDTMPAGGVRGTQGWTRVVLDVRPDSAAYIGIGIVARGRGTAWVDDVTLAVNGRTTTTEPTAPPPTAAEVHWLRARARPLGAVDPAAAPDDFTDLAPLGALVGDAPLVGLGEGTHGTREFYQAKHRAFAYLARHHGFTLLMLEANQLAAERLNHYVLTGEGEPRELLRGVFKILQTEEVLALLRWARAHNAAAAASGAARVEIVGYDAQDAGPPVDSLRAFLGRVEPALVAIVDSALGDLRETWRTRSYLARPESAWTRWQRGAAHVVALVHARENGWLVTARTRDDSVAVRWAVQNARVVQQAAALPPSAPNSVRDSAMAENIVWTLEQRAPGARAVIWAHNYHVMRVPGLMGGYLERLRPGGYRPVALTSASGQYGATANWSADTSLRRITPYTLPPAPRAGVEHWLARLPWPALLVDVRGAADAPDGRWLTVPRPFLSVGGAATDYPYLPEPMARSYDGVLFVRRTSAIRVLP